LSRRRRSPNACDIGYIRAQACTGSITSSAIADVGSITEHGWALLGTTSSVNGPPIWVSISIAKAIYSSGGIVATRRTSSVKSLRVIRCCSVATSLALNKDLASATRSSSVQARRSTARAIASHSGALATNLSLWQARNSTALSTARSL